MIPIYILHNSARTLICSEVQKVVKTFKTTERYGYIKRTHLGMNCVHVNSQIRDDHHRKSAKDGAPTYCDIYNPRVLVSCTCGLVSLCVISQTRMAGN